ncbi:MAG: ABC transporter permease subunit [Actinobacteria bacterium]|nr:ABC transporter permease subunit [Actinomycetota bacterium]
MTSTTWRVWLRRNLFRNLRDGIITLLTAFIAGWILWKVLRFVLITGRWEIVERNLALFMYGRYPREDLWRITLALCVAAFVTTMLFSMWSRADRAGVKRSPRTMLGEIGRRWWPLIVLGIVLLSFVTTVGPWIAACAAIACLFAGALLGRALSSAPVRIRGSAVAVTMLGIVVLLWFLADGLGWDDWGGLMLSLYLAAAGMVLSFPLGVLLAIGRQSSMPIIRSLSIAAIEITRGVPLVVLIILSSEGLGFFFPQDVLPGKVVRVIVVLTIFTAAYVAEIVRGGLQSVPNGQSEAAAALGLSPTRITAFIVLPQALGNVIPALVGQFISLFKDTTLVSIIGLLDVISVSESIRKQSDFKGQGLVAETLVFAGLLFWVGSSTLSRESRRMERRLGVGER